MRILVLGGTGLISTAIVRKLLADGHEPILYNRGATPSRIGRDVETIVGDRDDFDDFAEKAGAVDCDAVIDMITFDAATARNNVDVFGGKIGHYLFCSTVCVYGGRLSTIPATEEEPHRPVSEYGAHKSAAEEVFMEAHRKLAFPVTIFRPSHCYGPGQPLLDIWGYNPCLVNRLRQGLPILLAGDGYGLWQPGHIDDMAKGFAGALAHKETLGQAYNLVGDEIMDWRGYIERMAAAIGCEARIVCRTTSKIVMGSPKDKVDMLVEIFQYHAAYTNAKLKAHVPEFTGLKRWEDGVRETVAWMDEVYAHRPPGEQPWIDGLIHN